MALAFSALYFLSDVIEVMQGGFSTGQLWLTLIAEAAIPVFVVGLAIIQQPRFGSLGMLSALAYAYSYVIFAGTVVYALVNNTKDYQTLSEELGAVMIVHGAVMVLAGLGFGYAVHRTRLLPTWTAVALMVGVILVALAQDLPDGVQLVAAGVRALGFAGMGVALLHTRRPRETRVLMGLLLFNSVSSIGGGLALMTGLIPEQAQWVEHTDFASLYFPGVILMAVVGGSSAIAAVGMAKHSEGWQISSIVAGVIMLFWIVGEVASIRGFHFLQVIYFVTGALVVWYTPRRSSSPLTGQRT